MEIYLRAIKEEERKYTFVQSFQIRGMTGLIGVLRGTLIQTEGVFTRLGMKSLRI